jgi:hypothetical protein
MRGQERSEQRDQDEANGSLGNDKRVWEALVDTMRKLCGPRTLLLVSQVGFPFASYPSFPPSSSFSLLPIPLNQNRSNASKKEKKPFLKFYRSISIT